MKVVPGAAHQTLSTGVLLALRIQRPYAPPRTTVFLRHDLSGINDVIYCNIICTFSIVEMTHDLNFLAAYLLLRL